MGSNLNLSGEIECDASIMDGQSLQYGAVGAISGKLIEIRNLFDSLSKENNSKLYLSSL